MGGYRYLQSGIPISAGPILDLICLVRYGMVVCLVHFALHYYWLVLWRCALHAG